MMLSFANKAIMHAHLKGYVVTKDGDVFSKRGKKRKLAPDKYGYLRFTIKHEDTHRQVQVHKLQAYQKYGSQLFQKGIQVRHYNNIRNDNSENNIKLGTPSQNRMDMPEEQRVELARKAGSTPWKKRGTMWSL